MLDILQDRPQIKLVHTYKKKKKSKLYKVHSSIKK